ncbi:MAG: hypothetical protein ACRDK0_01405 [Solirubrobacteraceae bacterium]
MTAPKFPWWESAELVALTGWMLEHDYDAGQICDAVEKPWKYAAEWRLAKGIGTIADRRELGMEATQS